MFSGDIHCRKMLDRRKKKARRNPTHTFGLKVAIKKGSKVANFGPIFKN